MGFPQDFPRAEEADEFGEEAAWHAEAGEFRGGKAPNGSRRRRGTFRLMAKH